jgi:hypothetical protein
VPSLTVLGAFSLDPERPRWEQWKHTLQRSRGGMAGNRRKASRGNLTSDNGNGGSVCVGDVTSSSSSVSPTTPACRRVDAIKIEIAQLHARDAELTERIEREEREEGSNKKGGGVTASSSVPPATLASRRVDTPQAIAAQHHARDAKITEQTERDHRKQDEVRAALAEAEAELVLEVNAPVANGVDPTEWLPEELLMAILIQVVTAGVCGLVCRRWHTACQDGRIKRRAWEGRWEGYSAGWRAPQELFTQSDLVCALAVGPDGTVYSGSLFKMVRAWSGTDGTLLRTLKGHTQAVQSLAVGADGTCTLLEVTAPSGCGLVSMAAACVCSRVILVQLCMHLRSLQMTP